MTETDSDGPITMGAFAAMAVSKLNGVGPKRVEALEAVGITTVLDLLTHYPRRYIDRTNEARIADLVPGEEAMVLARVQRSSARRTRGGRSLVTVDVSDGSGHMKCTFFNQAWRERQLSAGTEAVFFGKFESNRYGKGMTSPVVDLVGDRTGRIVPVYPQSEKAGLTTWEVGAWVDEVLRRSQRRGIADPVPAQVRARWGLSDRGSAIRSIHAPDSMAEKEVARRRLVFDELLRIQLALVRRKRLLERTSAGVAHAVGDHEGPAPGLVQRFVGRFPYRLTAAQERVLGEIRSDLARPVPMHRLLQGDVGSGKTVVATCAMLTAVQGGHQAALMAPTEVLADQHHLGIRSLLDGLTVGDDSSLFGDRPLTVALLTNRTTAAERRRLHAGLESGEVHLVIGTHALIQEAVQFRSLGVVVIDEQHRFGVEQRAALREKGDGEAVPDVLVMTATPIPRTAAMTVYGDLDVSILDELPPGRTQITTVWPRTEEEQVAVWEQVRAQVAAGRQAYVVCPLIEGSEKLEAASAEETFGDLSAGELSGLHLGLLHGRVAPAEKEAVMDRFRAGSLDVLVATTVIEVGVDVPNATVMVVLDADRFGVAQLHQLRGRVGRGEHHSTCYLVAEGRTPDSEARLEALVRTTDGFELAEVDLDLRGEGTVMGERQKGRNDLKLASLRRDREWVERAREAAFEIVGEGDGLDDHPGLADELELFLGQEDTEFLLKS